MARRKASRRHYRRPWSEFPFIRRRRRNESKRGRLRQALADEGSRNKTIKHIRLVEIAQETRDGTTPASDRRTHHHHNNALQTRPVASVGRNPRPSIGDKGQAGNVVKKGCRTQCRAVQSFTEERA